MSPSLREFVSANRQLIIERTQERVAQRSPGHLWDPTVVSGIPLFLTQLVEMLALHSTDLPSTGGPVYSKEMVHCAGVYGQQQLRSGFSVAQVVHGYGDVCQVVTELASEAGVTITTDEFQAFNSFLDDAIAGAVTAYASQREQDLAYEGTERMGVLAHELRNFLNTAVLSFDVMKKGVVGLAGSTAAIHSRSLAGLRTLVERTLAEVRLEAGVPRIERVRLAEFVGEIQLGAAMEAAGKDLNFSVSPLTEDVPLDIDRQLLASAVTNLLQNAFKFTRPQGYVELSTRVTPSSVFLEVSDECGGLPPGKAEEFFKPFTRGSQDKSGLGLGLSIALRAAHANQGELRVRDVPGTGCVFSIELPRQSQAAMAAHVTSSGADDGS